VAEGSPADRAGLAPGDVLTRFQGIAIEAEKEEDLGVLQRLIASVKPGQQATLELLREGKPRRVEIRVGSHPNVEPAEAESELGFHVQEITPNLVRDQRLAVDQGAFVSFVARGSAASEAGLVIGDVIERIEGRAIQDLEDFRAADHAASALARLLIVARRGAETKFLLVHRGGPRARPPEPEAGLDPARGSGAAPGTR
jgi:serine protease Do